MTRVTRRMPHMEKDILTFLDHPCSIRVSIAHSGSPVRTPGQYCSLRITRAHSGLVLLTPDHPCALRVSIARSLVFCVMLLVLLFCPLCCMSYYAQLLITSLVSSNISHGSEEAASTNCSLWFVLTRVRLYGLQHTR